MKISLEKIELLTSKKINFDHKKIVAFDTATKTGWCIATLGSKYVELEYGSLEFRSADKNQMYDEFIKSFKSLIKDKNLVVIEESWYGRNVKTFQLLSRLGMIAYVLAYLENIPKYFIGPSTSRTLLGLPGNKDKKTVQQLFKEKFDIKIENDNAIDAIILALGGLLCK